MGDDYHCNKEYDGDGYATAAMSQLWTFLVGPMFTNFPNYVMTFQSS